MKEQLKMTEIPKIQLSDFIGVMYKSGLAKTTKVAEIKNRDDYSPASDTYKLLREHIVRVHKNGLPKSELDKVLSGLTDKNKKNNYPPALEGYKSWLGRKVVTWFSPSTSTYNANGMSVSVNPELGLLINGQKYLIKLYFKSEKLSKIRATMITGLMEIALRKSVGPDVKICILDTRNAKLYEFSGDLSKSKAAIDAEMAYIASLWATV